MAVLSNCKHYRCHPGGRVECAKGVDIRAHVGGESFGWMRRMPCVTSRLSSEVVPCALVAFQTPEEQRAEIAELDRAAAIMLAGKCPGCGSSLTVRADERSQAGACPNGCPYGYTECKFDEGVL